MPNLFFDELPSSARYIFIDNQHNIRVLHPIVGGEDIGSDNTCQAGVAAQSFWGLTLATEKKSAIAQLEQLKARIKNNLKLLLLVEKHDDKKNLIRTKEILIKIKQIKQINDYIYDMEEKKKNEHLMSPLKQYYPKYPSFIKKAIKKLLNLFVIKINVLANDPVTNFDETDISCKKNDLLSVKLRNLKGLIEQKKLDTTHDEKIKIKILKLTESIINKKLNSETIKELERIIVDFIEQYVKEQIGVINFSLNENFYREEFGFDGNFQDDGFVKCIVESLCIDEDETINSDMIENIFGYFSNALKNVLSTEIESPFASLKQKTKPTKGTNSWQWEGRTNEEYRADQFSIMIQFLLAEIKIYCTAKGKIKESHRKKDFSDFLSYNTSVESAKLLDDFILKIRTFLSPDNDEKNIEKEIMDFFISKKDSFGISEISKEDTIEILNRFKLHYKTISESPHFDEFIILDSSAPGNFYSHQGEICFDYVTEIDGIKKPENIPALPGKITSENKNKPTYLDIPEGIFEKIIANGTAEEIGTMLSSKSSSDTMFFSTISDAQALKIKGLNNYNQIKKICMRNISDFKVGTDEKYSKKFKEKFNEDQAIELTITQKELNSLYALSMHKLSIHEKYSFFPAENHSEEEAITFVIKIFRELGIALNPGCVYKNNTNDGFVIKSENQGTKDTIEKKINESEGSMFLSPDMAGSLYMALHANHPHETHYKKAMELNNNERMNPRRIKKTLDLLGINYNSVHCIESNGFYLETTKDNLDNIINQINSSVSFQKSFYISNLFIEAITEKYKETHKFNIRPSLKAMLANISGLDEGWLTVFDFGGGRPITLTINGNNPRTIFENLEEIKSEYILRKKKENSEKAYTAEEVQSLIKSDSISKRKRYEEEARRQAEEQSRLEEEEQHLFNQAEMNSKQDQAQLEAAEKAKLDAEKQAQLEAAEKARLEVEKARLEVEKARLEAVEKDRLEAEKQAQLEAAEKARLEAEKQARRKDKIRHIKNFVISFFAGLTIIYPIVITCLFFYKILMNRKKYENLKIQSKLINHGNLKNEKNELSFKCWTIFYEYSLPGTNLTKNEIEEAIPASKREILNIKLN